jgi:E3 ubiquitin-protein ligase ATL6/9/15/31/42/55
MSAFVVATAFSLAAGAPPEASDDSRIAAQLSISIFVAVFLHVFILLLALACFRLFCTDDDASPPGAGAGSPVELARRGPGGLDADAIAALPLVFYREVRQHRIVEARDGDGDDALECSVCLTEFEDDDALRLLLTCPHAFHPECIGIWLERHATCPLCRASLLDAPEPVPQPQAPGAPLPPDGTPDHPTVVLIGDASDRDEDEEDRSRFLLLARNRQAVPRSNSTGHDGVRGGDRSSTERFALRLPEHVRVEIHMSHRLRHVTSAVESVRVREGSSHGSAAGGSVRGAVARLLSRFAPGSGCNGDGENKADAAGEEKINV